MRDYKKLYFDFIESRKMRPILDEYGEWHHIKARCQGGGDEPENLIWLTSREHCFAHLLMAYAYGGKLWLAATAMTLFVGERKGVNSRMAAIARREAAKAMSGDNSPVADRSIYRVRNLVTEEITEGTRAHMNEVLGIPPVRMYMLITGRARTYENFAMAETQVPKHLIKGKVHEFERISTGEVVCGTRTEMLEKYGMPLQASLKLLVGDYTKWRDFRCFVEDRAEEIPEKLPIYVFTRVADGVKIICDRRELEKEYGVPYKGSASFVKGKPRVSHGLEYVGEMIDGVLFEHKHPEKTKPKCQVKDQVRRWVRVSDGAVFERTRKQMAEEFGISLTQTRSFLCKNLKTVKGFYIEGADITNNSKDNRVHRIKHIDTGQILEMTREEIMTKLGLGRSSATNLIQGRAYNNMGYCLADTEPPPGDLRWPDKTVYEYENIKTGAVLHKTRKQMTEELGFTSQQLTNLKTGYIKSSKGYKLNGEAPSQHLS